MKYNDRIVIDHAILGGKPIIKGTRLSVEFILELLGNDWSREMIIENYPQLENEDVLAALCFSFVKDGAHLSCATEGNCMNYSNIIVVDENILIFDINI